ncbi:MAG: hypothetical protein V4590_15165 [Bacteroidota bacterium]
MVKQLTLILFTIFLCMETATAQIVEWSNQQKIKSKTSYTRIIGQNASGIYVLRGKNSEFTRDVILEKYKSNLALENTIELDNPYNSYIEKVLLQDDGVVVVSSQRNDSLRKVDLYALKVNALLQVSKQRKLLAQIDESAFKNNSDILIQPSVNKEYTTVLYYTQGTEKSSAVMHLHGFDGSLNATYTKTVNLQFDPDDIVVSGLECDNDGNAFVLVDYPKAGAKKRKDKEIRDFFLYGYYKTLDKILEYPIERDSAFINDIGLVVNNYKKTVCVAGFYSDDNSSKAIGSFTYGIDATSTLVQYKSYELFPASFANKIITTMLNETGPHLTDLYIRKLIPRSDGGCVIVAEKYYETRQTYTYYANGFPQTASRTSFNFDEIIVISKNGEGVTQFADFIKKKQTSTNDGGYYSSFVLLNANDKLAFAYNADTNEESDVLISTINPLGQVDTKILIKALSYYVSLIPTESKQIGSNTSLICTLKDRRFTLMKLTY